MTWCVTNDACPDPWMYCETTVDGGTTRTPAPDFDTVQDGGYCRGQMGVVRKQLPAIPGGYTPTICARRVEADPECGPYFDVTSAGAVCRCVLVGQECHPSPGSPRGATIYVLTGEHADDDADDADDDNDDGDD